MAFCGKTFGQFLNHTLVEIQEKGENMEDWKKQEERKKGRVKVTSHCVGCDFLANFIKFCYKLHLIRYHINIKAQTKETPLLLVD